MSTHNICFCGEIRKIASGFSWKSSLSGALLSRALPPEYEGCAKSFVTNRLPKFDPMYILKCFTALEWCVE